MERTGIDLMFLDVTVTDRRGRPVRGLTRDDFVVLLDGRERPVYSVDDLCRCGAASGDPAPGDPAPSIVPAANPPRFTLYFDFSQLQIDGRVTARKEAEHWIREVMRPGDQAKIAGYASLPGLREFCPYTADRQSLLDALQAAFDDPNYQDPFPGLLRIRLSRCPGGSASWTGPEIRGIGGANDAFCRVEARDEFLHGRQSLKALATYLGRQEGFPGRKAMLLFNQNGVVFPGRLYGNDDFGLDHVTLVERVGAEASMGRTAIYTVFAGTFDGLSGAGGGRSVANDGIWGSRNMNITGGSDPAAELAVNLGANLADFTGGDYNRSRADAGRLVRQAAQDCACLYRIALRPPDNFRNHVYRTKVWAAGRALPFRYRVQFLDDEARWWRDAQWVLAHPESADDLTISAGIIPTGVSGKNWDLEVQVVLDIESLALLPGSRGRSGEWEVGALLTRDGDREYWELLGSSRAVVGGGEGTYALLLHEHAFAGLKPGEYRLRAFVRDGAASLYGGGEATLTLPRTGRADLAGPILMRAAWPVLVQPLPLSKTKVKQASDSSQARKESIVPAKPLARPGETLEFLSWACPGDDSPRPADVQRFVTGPDGPLFRFDEPAARSGSCLRILDRVSTAALEPRSYTYHVRFKPGGESAPIERELVFEVIAAEGSGRGDEQ